MYKVRTDKFPHNLFQSNILGDQRCSQIKFNTLEIKKQSKQNDSISKLTGLALKSVINNKHRHSKVQNFLLINDNNSVAVEVPIYLTKHDIKYYKNKFSFNVQNKEIPITGHIDVLQVKNNLIHVLDYKLDASKINAVPQLTLYCLALAPRLNMPLRNFKAGWFDENNLYEFFPLSCVNKLKY